MILPRPYQEEQLNLLRENFKQVTGQILASPTGSGKTVVMGFLAKKAADNGKRVWVLTDRKELCKQSFDLIDKVMPSKVQVIDAGTTFQKDASVTIAMVETLHRRLLSGKVDIPAPDLILIDEAHKQHFNKVLDRFPDTFKIGVTATPLGKHITTYYEDIVQNIDIPDLIAEGYLCPVRAFQMEDDFSDVSVQNGEFKNDELHQHFDDKKLFKGVVEQYQKRTPNEKAICFNVNVEHAHQMKQEFLDAGISSEVVTGKTPKRERDRIIDAFKAGAFKVLHNCGVLVEGFDDDTIETVILNRATNSLTMFLQMIGRGSRPAEGKNFFNVLDFGMNHNRHGLWDEPREWELKPPPKKKREAPVKDCESCGAIVSAMAVTCPHCGAKLKDPPEKGEQELAEGEMKEVQPYVPWDFEGRKISTLTIDELIKLQKAKQYKASFIWRVVRTHGKEYVKDYAKKMGYSPGWIKRQLDEMEDKNGTGYKDYILRDKREKVATN